MTFSGLTYFTKVSILQWFRCHGEIGLKWAGAVSQLSASVGAISIFLLVNETSLFTENVHCEN